MSTGSPGRTVLHHALVGQGAGGARDHAFAARDARRIAHRQVVVERDAGHEALASAPEHVVVPDLIAAANAAIAEDAGFVIHRDYQRRVVLPARRNAAWKARLGDAFQARQRLQLAIARLPLARAGAGMIGHQHLDQSAPRPLHFVGTGVHHHVVLGRPHA